MSLGAQERPATGPKCVVTMIPSQSDQSVTVGIKSGPFGPSKYLWDSQKGLSGPKKALLGARGAQDRPDIRPKCMVTMIPTKSDQLVAVGTKFDPSWPSKDLWDPQKGLSGPKLAHLGALGAQKRPDTRPKCVVTMILTQSDQSAAVGTKSGPSGPSESLWGPQKGLSGPKRALLGPWSAVEVR